MSRLRRVLVVDDDPSIRGDWDKIRAVDLGADDYVTEPVSLPELLARVRTQLRRSAPECPLMRFPDLVIDGVRLGEQ